jgi:hypothetical protein
MVVVALGLAAGCSDETGVLLVIARDPERTPDDIEKLEIHIGVSAGDGAPFVEDGASIQELRLDGRDLASNPYELMVRDGTDGKGRLMVAVIAYRGDERVGFAGLGEPQGFKSGQVLRKTLTVSNDRFDVTATGCVRWDNHAISDPSDQDCDDAAVPDDCNDLNPDISPDRPEICGNGVDENCKLGPDENVDEDGDNFTTCQNDCNDTPGEGELINPGAEEKCDGVDNNCKDGCDEDNNGKEFDADGDGYTQCGFERKEDQTCGSVAEPDCNDIEGVGEQIHPNAIEVCNGRDDNCDQKCDPLDGGFDADKDGLTDCGSVPDDCFAGANPELADCKDGDPDVRPGFTERCDGKDTNCDGERETEEPCYEEGEGACRLGTRACDDDDSDGSSGLADTCQVSSGDLAVLDPLCQAYDTCEEQMAPDLFECANEEGSLDDLEFDCQLFYKAGPSPQLCGQRFQPLSPPDPMSDCSWDLLGGTRQRHYEAGVAPQGSGQTPTASTDVCAADLHVVDKEDVIPQPDVFTLLRRDGPGGGPSILIQFRIQPEAVGQCPEKGLDCAILP